MRVLRAAVAGLLAVLSLVLAPAPLSAKGEPAPVRYRLTPVFAGEALSQMEVEIRFQGDADGSTRLVLPEKWAGSSGLRAQLSDFVVKGASASDEQGQHMMLRHRPNAGVTVRYRVASAYTADPDRAYEKARPVIRPAWFLLMGEGVFGYPQGSDERRALFRWGRFPKGWRVASDLDHLAGERPGSVYDVVESVSIGGTDLTVEERVLGGKRARIAARGSWPFELGEFSARMAGIMEAQNRYWRDPGRPFLVVVAPLAGGTPNETFSHGTGRSDAFAFASSTNQPLKDMARVLAHESMHTWLARELGGPLPKDEALGYWFSEGFNDYLAARLLLRGGDWALEDYVAELNRVVRRYTLSPARSAPDRLVLEKFWSDSSYGQLPYDRGHLLALLIDYRMRGAGGGRTLDDVLLAQKQRAQAQSEGGGPTPAPLLFPLMMREVGGLDVSGLLDRHLNLGEPIALPDDLFGECGRFEAMREPMFDFGFDAQASRAAGNVVRGVDPAGPAYAAGLRDGMRLARIESASRETGEIVFLLAGEPEQRIRYVRRKSGENVFPRFVLSDVASVEKRERCRVRMAGV